MKFQEKRDHEKDAAKAKMDNVYNDEGHRARLEKIKEKAYTLEDHKVNVKRLNQ